MKSKEQIEKEIRIMLLLSRSYYDTWFKFWLLRAPNEVGQKQAELNLKIYKDFGNLFVTFEESVLTSFSVIFSQLFDRRKDVVSLYFLNQKFNKNFEEEITALRDDGAVQKILTMRMKFFAHNDNTGKHLKRIMPSDIAISEIFSEMVKLFEKITGQMIILRGVTNDELSALFSTIEKSNPRRYKL